MSGKPPLDSLKTCPGLCKLNRVCVVLGAREGGGPVS